MGAWLALAIAAFAQPPGGAEAKRPTNLFAQDQPIRATLRGPISAVASTPAPSRAARPAVLELAAPASESQPILLSPRGLTRRKKETCAFPPLRIEFSAKPAKTSLFERQKRL